MSDSRFDEFFKGKSEAYLLENGLVEMTPEEEAAEQEAMSMALPLSLLWKNKDDNEKYVQWDSALEKHLQDLARLIDHGGRESFEPFNIYQEMGLNWLDNFALNQSSLGSCCGAAHRNATMKGALVIAKLKGNIRPVEHSLSITYALGRGNLQRLAWGSGLNLQPMSRAAARFGNYLTSDMGRYDTRGSNVNESNRQRFAPNALKHQSIPCYLPNLRFDTFYEIARAGFAVNIGSSTWPSGSIIDSNGMSIGQGTSRGAHATEIGGHAIEINGTKYILWTNSHGPRFRVGTRIKQNPFGTYITEANFNLLALNTRFGVPYIAFTELGLR